MDRGIWQGYLGGSDSKEPTCNVGDLGSIPGSRRSSWRRRGNPLQYSCLENSMERGAWWAIQSLGSQRVGHDWATKRVRARAHTHTHTHTVGPCSLSVLYTVVCICQSQSPNSSLPTLCPGKCQFVFYIHHSISVSLIHSFVPFFQIPLISNIIGYLLSLSDLLHLVWQSLGSSMLLQTALFHFYGWVIFPFM